MLKFVDGRTKVLVLVGFWWLLGLKIGEKLTHPRRRSCSEELRPKMYFQVD